MNTKKRNLCPTRSFSFQKQGNSFTVVVTLLPQNYTILGLQSKDGVFLRVLVFEDFFEDVSDDIFKDVVDE